ncbi:MAG: carboxymuconolactone decarboxylase family protein [Paraburkholderia sp.]|uniref:carboxymuconolactone decarboxylase family protein n=1 Tax=Paraburkholderia sp. TaxID=1926495 RepID=UPI00121683C6|nr:carboxymuconolactone decarboxylase family protein [Paraburkholderia sp.]TAM00569.1 MAG: carboxymuconolactone decarboxylase family protein [Paraburkholderia sp.]TAM30911.1 MAG: carboxymuconolactone decarboxylase family protein [Paraburkholderia sp.]
MTQSSKQSSKQSSPPRLPAFDAAHATPEQKAVLDEILAGPRGNLNGPFLGWIHSPDLAQHAQRLGAFCRYRTGLPLRLSELAILVTAARWQAQAEWYIHYPIALQAGVPEALAQQIRTGAEPRFDDPDDALIHAFVTELYDAKRVSDETYARAMTRFGCEVTVNLVGLLGYYAFVAMTLNVFEMRAEGQSTLPFAE